MTLDFNPYDFSVIGSDGLTESNLATEPTYGCLPEGDLISTEIGPGENVTGKVVLDTANASGVLVYRPWYVTSGWEWNY